jgi:hypothetical protein
MRDRFSYSRRTIRGVINGLPVSGAPTVTGKLPGEFAVFIKEENDKWATMSKNVGAVME